MSLDTVLHIGKALRNAKDNLKHFKYVARCPKDKNGTYPLCITIPIDEHFNFVWENIKVTPENEREALYYLKFKTSNSDSSMRYLFGDIFYVRNSTIKKDGKIDEKEGGYYRLAYGISKSSFERANSDFEEVLKSSTVN